MADLTNYRALVNTYQYPREVVRGFFYRNFSGDVSTKQHMLFTKQFPDFELLATAGMDYCYVSSLGITPQLPNFDDWLAQDQGYTLFREPTLIQASWLEGYMARYECGPSTPAHFQCDDLIEGTVLNLFGMEYYGTTTAKSTVKAFYDNYHNTIETVKKTFNSHHIAILEKYPLTVDIIHEIDFLNYYLTDTDIMPIIRRVMGWNIYKTKKNVHTMIADLTATESSSDSAVWMAKIVAQHLYNRVQHRVAYHKSGW